MTTSDLSIDASRDWDFNKEYFQEVSLEVAHNLVDAEALSRKSFTDRVKLLAVQNAVATYLVDALVSVRGPSDAARAAAVKHWEQRRDQATFYGRANVVCMIASMAGAAVGAVLLPPAAVAGAVALVATAFFANRCYDQAESAQEQIDQWSVHPAQSITDMRSRAYAGGFFYAMNSGLKGTYGTVSNKNVMHPSEISWLYEQSLTRMMQDISTQMQRQNISPVEKTRWVEGFISQNLLSRAAIAFAYEANDPRRQILEAWAPSFEAFKQDVLTTQQQFSTRKQQVHNQAWEQIYRLEEQRDLALKVPLSLKKANNDEAWRVRQEAMESQPGLSDEARRRIIRDYEQALRNNESVYLAVATPINLYYDGWRANVEAWEKACLAQIHEERSFGMAPYFEPGLNLFASAYGSWRQQSLKEAHFYQSGGNQIFRDFDPLPSAPPMREVLRGG